MKRFNLKLIVLVLSLLVLVPSVVFADETAMPGILHGRARVTSPSRTYYTTDMGNYALFNINSYMGMYFTYMCTGLGTAGSLPLSPACFRINHNNSSNPDWNKKLLVSRTFVQYGSKYVQIDEMPMLYGGFVNVYGDTFGNNADYNNFSYWGRALAQVKDATPSGSSGETWAAGSYSIDENSYAYWDGDNESDNSTIAKIKVLMGEGKRITTRTLPATTWYLNRSSLSSAYSSEEVFNPEGGVWTYGTSGSGDLTISSSNKYKGVGTIVVNGNLTIDGNVQLAPVDEKTDSLGFIVFGNVTISSGAKVAAPIMAIRKTDLVSPAGGNITINSNVSLNGFYVARTFTGLNTNRNVQILYDAKLDNLQPPGFRNISGIKSGETGNR